MKVMTQKQKLFSFFFLGLLALALLLAADLPRFLALGPAATGLIGFIGCRLLGKKFPDIRNISIYIAPIIVLAALSALWAIDPGEVLTRTGKLAGLMLAGTMLLGAAWHINIEWLRPKLWIIPAALLAGAGLIAVELFLDAPLHRLFRGTDESTPVYDAVFNRGAAAYVICLVPAFALLRHSLNQKTAIALFAVAFAAMMLAIESQSAQLALLLSLLFMFAFPYRRKAAWITLGGLIALYIATAPFLAIWAFANLADTLSVMPFLQEAYAGPRLEIWDYVSRYILQNPCTGYGLEASRVITDFDSAQKYQEGTSILHPHNFAIQLWLEFGILGAGLGIAFCLGVLHAIYRMTQAHARIALPAFIAALSVASTGYGLWQSWWIGLLFLVAALCVLAIRFGGANDR
jgi:exopolysaccharide production protein ExoQ